MLEKSTHRVAGNEKVLEGLYKAIERTNKGLVRAMGIQLCEHHGVESSYWGDENAKAEIVFGCRTLEFMIISSTAKLQPTDPDLSMAQYDIGLHPICFDIIPWLATVEMARVRAGAPAPLKMCFVRTTNSLVHLTPERMAFFEKVIRPALTLFGAVEDTQAAGGRFVDFTGLRDIAYAYGKGEQIPKLQIPKSAVDLVYRTYIEGVEQRPVTITLRETGYYEYRNSNPKAWPLFARWLQDIGERVIVVRDTAKADEPLDGLVTCPSASRDLYYRAALYAQAKANLFVTNGPWALALFMDVPWLCFASIDDEQPEECNRPEWWAKFMGLNEQKQIVFANDKQRIVYKPDTFDNLVAAWKELDL